jgi:hypothetical protein
MLEGKMFHLNDSEEMTPEECLQEVSGILAIGYLRLKKQKLGQQQANSHIPINEQSPPVYRKLA